MSPGDRKTLTESADILGGEPYPEDARTLADVVRSEIGTGKSKALIFDELEDLEMISEIGRGGMGIVYRAVQRSLEREVAVKLLDPRSRWSARQMKRFHKEVLLAASLNHPNIAHIHWVKRQKTLFYFVMECVDGPSLAELLCKRRLSLTELVSIFVHVCDGLSHAHERGIVHRDLKPGNILVAFVPDGQSDGDDSREVSELQIERAVLVDFGLAARPGETSTTEDGLLMGTPAYMSPEQARGEPTDRLSDIYSLGVTLFEAVTGRVPFLAPTPLAMALKHLSDQPPDVDELVPNLPASLVSLVHQLLLKNPDDRPQSCAEVKERLLRCQRENRSPGNPGLTPTVEVGLTRRSVTILAVDLDGFMATAYDQALARTGYILEGWGQLVEDAVGSFDGLVLKQEAAQIIAVFNYPNKHKDHARRAIGALAHLVKSLEAFNHTNGKHLAFTAGLELGRVFLGGSLSSSYPNGFGRAFDTTIRLASVKNCGVGVVGPQLSKALNEEIPLEPLIGVAEDLGYAERIAPEYWAEPLSVFG